MSGRWGTHRHAAPPALRAAVLQRDGHRCTFIELVDSTIETADIPRRCTAPATDVHHVIEEADGGLTIEANLVSLCTWHHRKITGAHAARARWRTRTKRDEPRHPGLR